MEDSSACIHGSRGVRMKAAKPLISEVAFVARLAKAMLPPNPKVPWDEWLADYSRIRAAIGETYPDTFFDYEQRMWEPGGFHRALPARERKVEDQDRARQLHRPRGAGRRCRHARGRPRRAAHDHDAQQ